MGWSRPPVRRTGDLIASSDSEPVLKIVAKGTKPLVDKVSEVTGKDCNCSKRRDWLNYKIPFHRRGGTLDYVLTVTSNASAC